MPAKKKQEGKEPNKDEKIGFHKGCLQTLYNERTELIKLVQITETLMKGHIEELKKLGVEIKTE